MNLEKLNKNFDLKKIQDTLNDRLVVNEYFVMSAGVAGDDYKKLTVSPTWEWDKDYGAKAYLDITFIVTDNVSNFKEHVNDDDAKDNIDSGAEDEFRSVFDANYDTGGLKWWFGGVRIKVKKG